MFNIDFEKWARWLVPHFKWTDFLGDELKVILSPLRVLHDDFLAFRERTNYFLSFTGQVIYLEHLLNDQYDNINRGIYIEDLGNLNKVYFFRKSEERTPLFLHRKSDGAAPFYLFRSEDYDTSINFIIWIPSGVVYVESELRALVDHYRQAGKTYSVQVY